MVRHLHIFGKVQGVGFRYQFSAQAQSLGVSGWVRNRRSGCVEAMIEGEPEAINALIDWARLGPAAAQVEHVDVAAAEGKFTGFDLRPTE